MKNIKRIAVWSGPRNLSTALMRSFGSRNDFDILDEPFYASYLKKTGIKHPMFDEIIKSQSSDYKEVSEYCKNGYFKKSYQYQKHMTHHMINNDYLDFALSLKNVFLVREPVLVLRSYKKKNKNYDFQDLGFRQQFEIYKYLKDRLGLIPIVIDSDDLQNDPIRILRKLCDDLEIPYCKSMLRWKPGPKDYDGIWGVHWYKEINKTSGFITRTNTYSYKKNLENFSKKDKNIIDKANRYYLQIIEKKI